jgi:hypothetical protein
LTIVLGLLLFAHISLLGARTWRDHKKRAQEANDVARERR